MMKLSTVLVLGLTLATPAIAGDFKADLAECQERAALRMTDTGNTNATTSVINGAASILGAVIGGRDLSYPISGAAQQGVYGLANDARQREWKRQSLIENCLREKEMKR